ncbi:MAG TPA: DUF1559 domain-containing protein [Pirellulales bacterium]
MRTLLVPSCFVIAALTATVALAQKGNADRLYEIIAPVVDDQTLVVLHLDLSAIDPGASVAKLAELVQPGKEAPGDFATVSTGLRKSLEELKQLELKDLFVLINVADVPSYPLTIVVPISANNKTANVIKAQEIFKAPGLAGPKAASAITRDLLVIGSPRVVDRLKKRDGASGATARPEIAQAFEAVGDSAAQLLIVPSAETRRVVEEMLPILPALAGGGSIKPFTSGLRWMAVGLTVPPKQASLKLIVQTADAEAAKTLTNELANVLKALGSQPIVAAMFPKFEDLTRLLVPTISGDRLSLDWNETNGGLKTIVSLLAPPFFQAREAASTARSVNNLKQIGLAMHNYLSASGTFPPRAILSKEGKPLLSWRVAILPFLETTEGNKLYKEFHLDEPWDSEHNRRLIDRMPETLSSPLSSAAAGRTTYLAPIFPGGIFGGAEGLTPKQITDGLSNTILAVEGTDDHAVVWTQPDDIEIDQEHPGKGLLTGSQKMLIALMADGSVRRIPGPLTEKKQFSVIFTAHGGEVPQPLNE